MKINIQKINNGFSIKNESNLISEEKYVKRIINEIEEFDYDLFEEIQDEDFDSTTISLTKPKNIFLPLSSYQNDLSSYTKMRSNIKERLYCYFNAIDNKYSLKSFQKEGVDFLLQDNSDFKILADDMGLGKTVQGIYGLASGFKNGLYSRALIVVPNHLVFNWIAEFEFWAPNLKIGPCIPNKSINEEAWSICLNSLQVIVTSYEKIKNLPEKIRNYNFDCVVADEAQRVKNTSAEVTNSFSKLNSKKLWLLTGTPVENSKSDMITLLTLSNKTGANDSFKDKSEDFIRSFTRKYLLRRVKEDVLDDMPKVNIVESLIDLNPEQLNTYSNLIENHKRSKEKKMNPLQLFNLLRKTCDYDEKTKSSSKAEEIIKIVENVLKKGEKVVIFSYTLEPLKIIQELLSSSVTVGVLTGEVDLEKREEIKTNFQVKGTIDVLLATAQVAGTGATFTKANHVIFFNEWWNPALNAQARDRIVRIGQEKECFVYKFYTKDTVEERLKELLENKKELFQEIVEKLKEPKFVNEIIDI